MRKLLGALCCVFAATGCGRKDATDFNGDERPISVLPRRAEKTGAPATGTLEFNANREAIAPRRLREARQLTLTAGEALTVELPVDFSTHGVWAQVTTTQQGWLEVDGVKQIIGGSSLVFFPLSNKTLQLRSEKTQELTFELVGSNDSAGGGFEAEQSAAQTRVLKVGPNRIAEQVSQPVDDTFAKLARLDITASADGDVLIGRCGTTNDAPEALDVALSLKAGEKITITRWLQSGDLCAHATADMNFALTVEGRVRRFSTNSLRPVKTLTVLDTTNGVGGWNGIPTEGQSLDFSLSSLNGLTGVTHALLRVNADAPVALGTCANQGEALQPGSVTLVPIDANLCTKPSAAGNVQVSLIAVVTPRDEAPGVCGARPPMPTCAGTSLLERLNCLPGVVATERQTPGLPSTFKQYLVRVTQPVDHFKPDGATFTQRALLTVRDESAPVVLHTTGYSLFEYFSDVSRFFRTNELELEHRFFEESTPQPLDYSTLTIMQSAWDSHRIVELFSPIFTGNWVNTGHSKGGMTALYHRRFFPCDVVASAPYVMPLSLGKKDARYGPWLAQLGGAQYENCRQTFVDVDTALISRRAELAPPLRGTYTRMGNKENALYGLTGSSLWAMFQTGRQDDPSEGCPAWEPLRTFPDFDDYIAQYSEYGESFSDEALAFSQLDSYSYQTQNELGTPGSNRAHLEQFGPIPEFPDENELSFPATMALPTFEARAMTDVQSWLKKHGEHFFFLYGGFDPWTGGKVDIAGARDALLYVVPGASHGVSINDLSGAEREEAYSRLEGWLGAQRQPKRANKKTDGEALPSYRDFMHLHRL